MAKTPEEKRQGPGGGSADTPPGGNTPGQPQAKEENIRGFASLAYRDFRLLFLTSPLSGVGQQMRAFSNAYQVYELSGSSAQLGLTFLFQAIPMMVMGLFGGTLADIMERKKIININQGNQIVMALLLGVLTLSGHIEVWHIYVITFYTSLIGGLEQPARMAILPNIVPRSHLMNATTLTASSNRISQLVGPVLAGVAVGTIGISAGYFFNALLILPAFIAVRSLRVPPDPNRRKIKLNIKTIFEGLQFAIATRVIIAFILLDFTAQVTGNYQTMLPVIAKDVLDVGPQKLGFLYSAPAFGSLAGFFSLLMIGNVKRKGLTIILSVLGFCILLFFYSRSEWFFVSLILGGAMGLVDSIGMAVRQTSVQMLAPNEKRGRVVALTPIFNGAANSLSGAFIGFLAAALDDVQKALMIGSFIGGGVALAYLLFWKRVRDFTI